MNRLSKVLAGFCIVFSFAAEAQLSISAPASNVTLSSPPDYATESLGNPWDMANSSDLANFINGSDEGVGIANLDFTLAGMGFTILGADGAFIYNLSPGQCSSNPLGKNGQAYPIDTSKYRYYVIDMTTTSSSEMRALVHYGCNYATTFFRTNAIPTKIGRWRYIMDLATIGTFTSSNPPASYSASDATGIRLEPGYDGDVTIHSIGLFGAVSGTSTTNVSYSFSPSGNNTRYSLFLDKDTNPFNGYVEALKRDQNTGTSATVSSSYLFPGNYKVVGYASDDFATLQGDPWDFSEARDVYGHTTGFVKQNTTGFSGGTFGGTSNSGAPVVYLNNFDTTFSASDYRYLSFQLTSSAGGTGSVIWLNSSGQQLGTQAFTVSPGSQIYQINLASVGAWSGNIGRMIIVPVYASGVTFTFDFVSLRRNGFVSSLTNPTMVVSAGEVVSNHPPQFSFIQPDKKGGKDYATEVLGNPWNFDGINDISFVQHLSEAEILPNNYVNGLQGDFFRGRNREGNGDPYQTSINLSDTATTKIDASKYNTVSWKFLTGRNQDVVNGSVARIIWQAKSSGDTVPFNGDDTMTFDDWNEYVQDMTKVELEPLLHTPGTYINPPWHGLINMFRVDMHEFEVVTDYYIDWLRVTAPDEANSKYTITYNLTDTEDTNNVTLALYYNSTESTSGGTLITDDLRGDDALRSYDWDTSGLSDGTYYVYGVASDGVNSTTQLATGKIVISHSSSQDSVAPVLELSYPADGSNVYADSFHIAGYALDNIQTAIIEVKIDGQLVHTFIPNLFNKTARTANPNLLESSNAGFWEDIDISGLTNGSHTLNVTAKDTQGNSVSTTRTISKVSGNDPSPEATPSPENEPVVQYPVETISMTMTAKLSPKDGLLTVTAKGGDKCGTISLIAGAKKASVAAGDNTTTELGSAAAASSVTWRARNTGRLQIKGKSNTPVFLGVRCDDEVMKVASVRPGLVRKGVIRKTVASWIKGVNNKIR
jgi:hypothetical protein